MYIVVTNSTDHDTLSVLPELPSTCPLRLPCIRCKFIVCQIHVVFIFHGCCSDNETRRSAYVGDCFDFGCDDCCSDYDYYCDDEGVVRASEWPPRRHRRGSCYAVCWRPSHPGVPTRTGTWASWESCRGSSSWSTPPRPPCCRRRRHPPLAWVLLVWVRVYS